MDPASILTAALSILGTKAAEESAKHAVGDLWSKLKSVIQRKHGTDSAAANVIDEVKQLSERVQSLGLADDPEIAPVLKEMEALVIKQFTLTGGINSSLMGNTIRTAVTGATIDTLTINN